PDAAASSSSRGIGYAYGSEAASAGTFLGQPADASSIVARFTVLGDANLDGKVGFEDLVALAQHYDTTVSDTSQSWWYRGDFDYNGKVDFADLVKLAQNYDTALAALPIAGASAGFDEDLARAMSAVPAPSALLLAALAGLGLARRSRRAA